jgi:hypothetical protein
VAVLTWGALGFFLFVLLAGLIGLTITGLRAWRTVRTVQRESTDVLGRVMGSADTLTANLDRLERKTRDLELAVAHLRGSLARAAVLLGAVQEIRDAVSGIQAFVPSK